MRDPQSDQRALDCVRIVVTPENVRFDYRVAGPFPRAIALLLDYIVIILIVAAFGMAVGLTAGDAGDGFLLILFFVLMWGYAALFETFWNGQTPGKKAMGLRVVSENGLPINAQQAFLRCFLRMADVMPFGLAGLLSMMFTRHFQRLGDLAAGTIVVLEGKQGRIRTPQIVLQDHLKPDLIPARYRPDPALIEGLTLYMARREKLSKPRRREIASSLARHFITLWSLPRETNPDDLLCLLYATFVATQIQSPLKEKRTAVNTVKRHQQNAPELTEVAG